MKIISVLDKFITNIGHIIDNQIISVIKILFPFKNDIREYYQVVYLLVDEKVIEREFGAFNFVPDNFPKYVLSMDYVDFSREGVIHKNIINFMIEEQI